jgi:DNA-binding HxlR family transcriptional regulator
MRLAESIMIIKALADHSRLEMMHALLDKPQYVEELSTRLHLAVSTVSFHLKKLEAAKLVSKVKEQYYVMYHADGGALELTLRELIAVNDIETTIQEERLQQYRTKVIRTFFARGKLVKLPAQQKKRRIVLEEFARRFEAGQTYSEQEVNTIIAAGYDDYCTIRRELVDMGTFKRAEGQYWMTGEIHGASSQVSSAQQPPSPKEQKMDRRKMLIREYKANPPPSGIFQITNRVNGKILIGSGMNVRGKINSHQAQLKMGVLRNKGLQEDWNTYGPDQFAFEVIDYLESDADSLQQQHEDLTTLEAIWLEKLQPYGEKGYNRPPKPRA